MARDSIVHTYNHRDASTTGGGRGGFHFRGSSSSSSSSSSKSSVLFTLRCVATLALLLVIIPFIKWSLILKGRAGGSGGITNPIINIEPVANTAKYRGTLWTTPNTLGVKLLGETSFARCDVHSVRVPSHDGNTQHDDDDDPSSSSSSSSSSKVINDWIFLEEGNHINVAVRMATTESATTTNSNNSNNYNNNNDDDDHMDENYKFLVFETTKYAIPGLTLSPVGGFIDDGETPWEAARREVWEELGVASHATRRQLEKIPQHDDQQSNHRNEQHEDEDGKTNGIGHAEEEEEEGGSKKDDALSSLPPLSALTSQQQQKQQQQTTSHHPGLYDDYGIMDGSYIPPDERDEWIFLGRYRTAANRGGGFLYAFYLRSAVPVLPHGGTTAFRGSGDAEAQRLVELTETELGEAVRTGKFQEVKWTATMSLALQHDAATTTIMK